VLQCVTVGCSVVGIVALAVAADGQASLSGWSATAEGRRKRGGSRFLPGALRRLPVVIRSGRGMR
jgi:hypothetical protein